MSQKQNELVEELVEELGALKEKNESLEHGVSNLREVVAGEQERVVRMLERDLAENRKHIRMFNSEANDLDQILSMGQPAKVNWGLRYQGSESTGEAKQEATSDALMVMWEGWTQEGGLFARKKSRNMAKKVNKALTKPKKIKEVFLAKSGLLDEIMDETS
ncbi:hypothetical protein F2Q69_00060474 [Brassica cretica]|uniref:Uncharacterized protein n=1 Tax=Brassica cretica TaxID=69181 RepID=A0A8S9RFP3_BRACR|nr:hypothetical protein F2Q69_00060474 [Brassica cretica]